MASFGNIVRPVVIVGGGIAGSALAIALARRGVPTLVVDRARFPRPKVCGGCLNEKALRSLARLDIDVDRLGARPVAGFSFRSGGRTAAFPLSRPSAALSRDVLDNALLRQATAAGAEVMEGIEVLGSTLRDGHRALHARNAATGESFDISAALVLAADGIGGTLARSANLALPPEQPAVIGAAARLEASSFGGSLPDDAITMVAGAAGYCGLVRLEDGTWNAAACLRADALRRGRITPGAAMAALLGPEGIALSPAAREALLAARACPPLRRRVRRTWAARLLLVGDAAGYHEPITGEGMAWALAGAERLAPLAARGWSEKLGAAWEAEWRAVVGRRTAVRVAAALLRRPAVACGAVAALSALPVLGSAFAAWIGRPLSPARSLP